MFNKKLLMVIILLGGTTCSQRFPIDNYHIIQHELDVQLEPQLHQLKAKDRITFNFTRKTKQLFLFLNKALKVDSVALNGSNIKFSTQESYDLSCFIPKVDDKMREEYQKAQLLTIEIPQNKNQLALEIFYTGQVYDSLRVAPFSREYYADQTTGIIDEKGVFLSEKTHWYPHLPQCLSSYKLAALTPQPYEVLSQGKLITKKKLEHNQLLTIWDDNVPTEALYLIAGPYQIAQWNHEGIDIYTYFYEQSQALSANYLEASAGYLEMYQNLFGDYPYSKFAVVENFFPTGYGLPSFTLLGSEVIRMPFIVDISLRHEVCHNWWGNGVFVDPEGGNWCEGLTTYCADYYYSEQKSPEAAREYRAGINMDYSSYVTQENDFPLRKFQERTTPASRAIGYGKSAMLFHQLRRMLDDEVFFKSLREFFRQKRFQFAGWEDLQAIFENISQQDLDWFFQQWVQEPGAPRFQLKNVRLEQHNGSYQVQADIVSEWVNTKNSNGSASSIFRTLLPVVLETEGSSIEKLSDVDSPKKTVVFECPTKPLALKVDPEHQVFRKLFTKEMVPSIRMILGDRDQLIIFPTRTDAATLTAYKGLVAQLNRTGEAQVKNDDAVTPEDLKNNALLIFGGLRENMVLEKVKASLPAELEIRDNSFSLFGRNYYQANAALIAVFRNPFNEEKSVLLYWGLSAEAIRASGHKLVHYGKYGYLVFQNGENRLKGQWAVKENSLIYTF